MIATAADREMVLRAFGETKTARADTPPPVAVEPVPLVGTTWRKDAAQDAKSEVFLRAQRSFASYDPGQPFRRWLLSIAGHYCTDQLRRRQTEARIFHPGELEQEELPSSSPSPLRQLLRAEQRDQLLEGIEALPPKYRLPLVLRYQAELDYAAIAEILEVPLGTLKSRLHAAVKHFARQWKAAAERSDHDRETN